jgi:2-phosphoglycerate kinase
MDPAESVINAITGLIRTTLPSRNDLFLKSILLIPTLISFEYNRVSLFLSLMITSLIDNLLKNLYSIEPTDIVDLISFEK